MRMSKQVLAAVLAGVLTLSTAFSGMAAGTGSPDKGNTQQSETTKETEKYPYIDPNTKDHTGNKVTSTVKKNSATTTKVAATVKGSKGAGVEIRVARTSLGKTVPITAVAANAFNSKAGKKVTSVKINSQKAVTIKAKAFNKSKVKKLAIQTKVDIKKNAFKATAKKNLKIVISNVKKAADIKFVKGSFSGLNKKAKITVKGMSPKQYNKLKKKLVKAGFKGKIVKK